MKHIVTFAAAALLSCIASAQTPGSLQVKTYTLSNGLTVWINEDHSQPKAFGAVVVKAGAKDCPETGIAHYFEHMMFKGTDKIGTVNYAAEKPYLDSIAVQYDALALADSDSERTAIQMEINRLNIKASAYAIPNEFDNLISEAGGANLNAYTSFDETVYHNEFISSYFDQWAELNSERIMNPVFRLFQSELETVYEEKNMYDNGEMSAFSNMILTEGFKGSPYACPVIGTTENLKNPRLSQMKEFFDRYYVASNMGLMLTGDVYPDKVLPVIEKTFGRIRRGEPNTGVADPIAPYSGRREIVAPAKIPLVKISILCYKAPCQKDPDCVPASFMAYLLNNAEGTGLLDRLTTDRELMSAICMYPGMSFREAGIFPIIYMPKLLFQSNAKAEAKVLACIDRLKKGDFDEQMLESCKLSYKRELISTMEKGQDRMTLMVNAFSCGKKWEDVVAEAEVIGALTKDDIVALANKYLGDDCLVIRKKFGNPEKESLQKPPYKSVVPESRNASSAYAQALRKSIERVVLPRPAVDFAADAQQEQLTPCVTLYSVKNPVNNVFNLCISYAVGNNEMPSLEFVSQYLNTLGGDGMDYDTLRAELQKVGGSISAFAGSDSFGFEVSGFDDKFTRTMELVSRLIKSPVPDRKQLKLIREGEAVARIMNKREAENLSDALLCLVTLGDKSPYLADKGRISNKAILDSYAEARKHPFSVMYSGTLPFGQVKESVLACLPVEEAVIPFEKIYIKPTVVDASAPKVYFVDKAKATQSRVYALVPGGRITDNAQRVTAGMYGAYLGGGMTSLLFQEIREFRSFAYHTAANYVRPAISHREDDIAYLKGFVGTQGDKTIEAMTIMDSLILQTPFIPEKINRFKTILACQNITDYPDFRSLAHYIMYQRRQGWDSDPSMQFYTALDGITPATLEAFWKEYVAGRNIVWTVVGDRKKVDMEGLEKFGEVVPVKKKQLFR